MNVKEGFPSVERPEMDTNRTKHVILTAWASVATALLLVLLIGGAFYVADLKNRDCEKTDSVASSSEDSNYKAYGRTFDDGDEKIKENFHLDGNTQTELIVKKTDDGKIEAIAGIDYKKKVIAIYTPAEDICLLATGIDVDWLDEWNSAPGENETAAVPDGEVKTERFITSKNKVTDLSILPREMIPFCEGKATYWMDRAADDGEDTRVKRWSFELHIVTETWEVHCTIGW